MKVKFSLESEDGAADILKFLPKSGLSIFHVQE